MQLASRVGTLTKCQRFAGSLLGKYDFLRLSDVVLLHTRFFAGWTRVLMHRFRRGRTPETHAGDAGSNAW
jgi:hypothetical protein